MGREAESIAKKRRRGWRPTANCEAALLIQNLVGRFALPAERSQTELRSLRDVARASFIKAELRKEIA